MPRRIVSDPEGLKEYERILQAFCAVGPLGSEQLAYLETIERKWGLDGRECESLLERVAPVIAATANRGDDAASKGHSPAQTGHVASAPPSTVSPSPVRAMVAPRLREVHRLTGHRKAIVGVSFNGRGDRLASVSEDGQILVWDLHTRLHVPIRIPFGFLERPRAARIHPRDDRIYVGYDRVLVYDTRSGGLVETLKDGMRVGLLNCLAISPDGQWLVAGRERGSCAYRITDGSKIAFPQELDRVEAAAFSGDGSVLAVFSGDGITYLASDSFQVQGRFKVPAVRGPADLYYDDFLSLDSSGGRTSWAARGVWYMYSTGGSPLVLAKDSFQSVGFLTDEHMLSKSYSGLHLYSTVQGKVVATGSVKTGFFELVRCLDIRGASIAIGCSGSVRLWEIFEASS